MDVKIISLNIWRGQVLDKALNFLKTQNPDIVALQEVTNSQDHDQIKENRLYEVLTQELGYPHHAFATMLVNNRPDGKIPEGVAVFSKYPLTEKETLFFEPFRDDYVDIRKIFRLRHDVCNMSL